MTKVLKGLVVSLAAFGLIVLLVLLWLLTQDRYELFGETSPEKEDRDATRHLVVTLQEPLERGDLKLLNDNGVRLLVRRDEREYLASVAQRNLSAPLPQDVLFENETNSIPMNFRRAESRVETALTGTQPKVEPWALVDEHSGRVRVLVQFYKNVEVSQQREALVGYDSRPYARNVWVLELTPEEAVTLADEFEIIQRIEQGPPPIISANSQSRAATQTDDSTVHGPLAPASYLWSGRGVRVGICDGGVSDAHPDMLPDRFYASEVEDASKHGTEVASVVGGTGAASTPSGSLRGHAPEAELGNYPWFNSDLAQAFFDAIVGDCTDLTNHSYNQSDSAGYGVEVAVLDDLVRGDGETVDGRSIPARPQVWAAGNIMAGASPYTQVNSPAKNTITVGSVDSDSTPPCPVLSQCRRTDNTRAGPTKDLRFKPDLLAPGCIDSTTDPNTGVQLATIPVPNYVARCDTSYAAPVVAGILALVGERIRDDVGLNRGYRLSSSYKALLIQTAVDLDVSEAAVTPPYRKGPDWASGWGLVNAKTAVELAGQPAKWNEAGQIGDIGDYDDYCVNVDAGETLRATLAWDDLPGASCQSSDTDVACNEVASRLQQDLDLSLLRTAGSTIVQTQQPLRITIDEMLAPEDMTSAYGTDRRNNVEVASADSDAAATWRIRVNGHHLTEPQRYSLFTSHDLEVCNDSLPCATYPALCVPPETIATDELTPVEEEADPPEIDVEPPLEPQTPTTVFDLSRPEQVDAICAVTFACPICDVEAWETCPIWDLDIEGLPDETKVVLFDEEGMIIPTVESDEGVWHVRIPSRVPGQRHFIVGVGPNGQPLERRIPVTYRSALIRKLAVEEFSANDG